jgi:hypothetical protein
MLTFIAVIAVLWLATSLGRNYVHDVRERFCDIFIVHYEARTGRRLSREQAWVLIRLAQRIEAEKAARRRTAEVCREAEERARRR